MGHAAWRACGAGEILLTSMDRDGTKSGFDLELTRAVSDAVPVPVIASGGVGTLQHLADGITPGRADAVLAASIFHFGEHTVGEGKALHGRAGHRSKDMTMSNEPSWMADVVFDENGLIPAIAQDADNGQIMMVAWMNRESLAETAATGRAVYWSRSRQRLWRKGEESGHVQKVHELRLDCDGDVVLLKVHQEGGIACHTGRASCFYRRLEGQTDQAAWVTVDPVLKDPELIYK